MSDDNDARPSGVVEQQLISDGGIAVGSYSDLEHTAEQPIDRNPSIPCRICNESFSWKDYWKDRITGDEHDPREVPFECDECKAGIAKMRRRLSDNSSLDKWGGCDG